MSEYKRLEALYRYRILDTGREEAYDNITKLAAAICDTPIAVVSLVDEARQWFKSSVGLEVTQTERCIAFCDYAIQQSEVLIVEDTHTDPRFAQNPLVLNEPHIRFYAGAPLITPEGFSIGTLCVIGKEQRSISEFQIKALESLAKQVMFLLDARLKTLELSRSSSLVSILKNAELAMRDSENRFRKIFSSRMFGIIFWNQQGDILDANEAFLEMVGYSIKDLREGVIKWTELTPMEFKHLDAKALVEITETGICQPIEKEYIRKDGSRVPILLGAASLDGNAEEGVCYVIDLTQQKHLENKFKESEVIRSKLQISEKAALETSKLKSEFLANMSHEIRTPINGVVGMVDLLSDTPLNAEQRDYFNAIKSSADSLLTIISDILDFSKIEADKLEFDNIDFDLIQTLAEIEKIFNYSANAKGIKLFFNLHESIPRYVKGDPGRLRQVFNNLISNAIKFTAQGRVIVSGKMIKSEQGAYKLHFEVKDTGIGIPDEAKCRIFNVFSQADSSTTRKFGGTGLGLSISKKLIEKMLGHIGFESTAGEGTNFWFEIKLEEGASIEKEKSQRPIELDKSLFGKRVLIVEDNLINQKIAMKMLEKMGLRSHSVGSGKEALNTLSELKYDLILMDCQMPEMDGYEATRCIRNNENLRAVRDIPIVAMTANALQGDREKCLEAGMDDYISKPVKSEDLFVMMERYLVVPQKKIS